MSNDIRGHKDNCIPSDLLACRASQSLLDLELDFLSGIVFFFHHFGLYIRKHC